MNAPAPGWNPDPTGRHEYRYWDGGSWTDDVSDNGVTSVDPVAGAPTSLGATTRQHSTQPEGSAPQGSGDDPYGGGQIPPVRPVRSGPSTGIVVGLAAVAVAVIAGLAFILTSNDDDNDTAADDIASSGSADAGSAGGEVGLDDFGVDLRELGESGEDVSTDDVVDLIARGIVLEADGLVTDDQARCAAQAVVDHFGVDGLLEAGTSGEDPFASASAGDQAAVITAIIDCIPVDVLARIGLAPAEAG